VRNEVSGSSYKRILKLHGKRAVVEVKDIVRESSLVFRNNGNIASVLIPLDENSTSALSTIENFVQTNFEGGKYKPLWLNDFMFCNVSHWCQFLEESADGAVRVVKPEPDFSNFGKGTYSMLIHASHVYVGPHKNGETYSLSLHVIQIKYKPSFDIMELIESLDFSNTGGVAQPQQAQTSLFQQPQQQEQPLKPAPKKKGARGGRNNKKARDEVDGHKNIPADLSAKIVMQ